MHVGMSTIFQNPRRARSDYDVYRDELRLADLAEPLGFESVWGVEHHFTDYTMCPDVVQFLSYMAGRTRKVKLGSMVIVLPWHDPLRVAEQVSLLDHLSDGRMLLGLGRGLGRVEFEGFRQTMEESRGRFMDYARMVLEGLERGYCEYDSPVLKQPRRDIRPAPFKSFRGRTYAAAVSPESSRIMAELGIGILIVPQKPWSEMAKELEAYRAVYRAVNRADAPPPVVACWTFCDESAERAEQMARRYIGGYYRSVLEHYEMSAGHLKHTQGYEYYGKFVEHLEKQGDDAMTEYFMDLQVWGTPKQCLERILAIRERVGHDAYIGVFRYAGMPYEEAERNLRLFAGQVMPELQRLPLSAEQPALRTA